MGANSVGPALAERLAAGAGRREAAAEAARLAADSVEPLVLALGVLVPALTARTVPLLGKYRHGGSRLAPKRAALAAAP